MQNTIEFIREKTNNFKPEIAIVLGSGLGELADEYCDYAIPYNEIPDFIKSTVHGHKGRLVFAENKDKKALKEFFIPQFNRERALFGSHFEIKLRNQLTQRAIARECADWIRRCGTFKSCVDEGAMVGEVIVNSNSNVTQFMPVQEFTTTSLGLEKGSAYATQIVQLPSPAATAASARASPPPSPSPAPTWPSCAATMRAAAPWPRTWSSTGCAPPACRSTSPTSTA